MIERKQSVIQSACQTDRAALEEELADLQLTLRLLEIAKSTIPSNE